MRQDPLLMVQKPQQVYDTLPGEFKTSNVLSDFDSWDRWADFIAGLLKAETEEEFEDRISSLKPLPFSITLQHSIDILGRYESGHQRITIDDRKISNLAGQIRTEGQNISDADLQKVVEIHELQHALHHLAKDRLEKDGIWQEFPNVPSYLLEILAQLFTHELCHSKKELDLAFIELEKRQPMEYRLWRLFRFVPKEGVYWMIRENPSRIRKILEKCGIIVPDASVSGWDVRRIAKIIEDDKEGNISPHDLPRIVEDNTRYPATVYPGQLAQECLPTAFFFSLTSRRYSNPDKGHVDLREIFDAVIRHVCFSCKSVTKEIIIITDNWNADSYHGWKPIFDNIRQNISVRVYLIIGASYSVINI